MAVKRSFKDMLPAQVKVQEPAAAPEPTRAPAQPAPVQQEANQPFQAPQPAAAAPTPVPAAPAQPESGGVAAASAQAPAPVPVATTAAAPEAKVAAPAEARESSGPARPHYTQLLRKELRVFQDQAADLKMLTMHINSRKGGSGERGERITDNTLVRVAIDLLFQRKDELFGSTEAELRASVGLPPRY